MSRKQKEKKARKVKLKLVASGSPTPPAPTPAPAPAPLRLDLGCGKSKREGFTGVDRRPFPGVDVVCELTQAWPWADNSVDEVHMSHSLEHFSGRDRVHIFNEMHRVMKPGAKALIITPNWASNRAYGDFTHAWPPVTEMLYFYLDKTWRQANAPDNDIDWNPEGYNCDFHVTWNYTLHPQIAAKNQEAQMFALSFYKEAASDIIATITKKEAVAADPT